MHAEEKYAGAVIAFGSLTTGTGGTATLGWPRRPAGLLGAEFCNTGALSAVHLVSAPWLRPGRHFCVCRSYRCLLQISHILRRQL